MSNNIIVVKNHDAKKRFSFAFDKLFNDQNSKKKVNKKFIEVLLKMSQNKVEHSEVEKDLENDIEGKCDNDCNESMRRWELKRQENGVTYIN